MKFVSLLGKYLKDPEVVSFLRAREIEVTYAFDEEDDEYDFYWATAKQKGFEIRFNDQQILDTVFCHIVANKGFEPINQDMIGVPVYPTLEEGLKAGKEGVEHALSGSGDVRKVVGIAYADHMVHYEYMNGSIFTVTLSHAPR